MKAVHPGSLHKKSLFDFYGFYNISYKVASDYEFLIKCGYSLKNYFINKPTIVMGANGISNLNYLLTLKEEYEIKSNNNLNNFTVANASPLALCLCVSGIPSCFVNFPKLYEFMSKINFLDNSNVHKVFLLKL